MKVNGVDSRKYNAKQLTAEVLPPSLSVDYEIVKGAALPTEFDTDIALGQLKLCMYFRGKDRNTLIRNMSAFLENFTKSSVLEIDGYRGKYRAFTSSSDFYKMKIKTRYQLNITLEGFFYDDELSYEYDGVGSATLIRTGTRKAPAIIEIYAKKDLENFKIIGFDDDIIVKELASGHTIIIDGETGLVTSDGTNAFDTVDIWSIPAISACKMNLSFSGTDASVKVRYKPMWI